MGGRWIKADLDRRITTTPKSKLLDELKLEYFIKWGECKCKRDNLDVDFTKAQRYVYVNGIEEL
jgi:hypothetical protein